MKIYYSAGSEKDDFISIDSNYQVSSAELTTKTGLELSTVNTCE